MDDRLYCSKCGFRYNAYCKEGSQCIVCNKGTLEKKQIKGGN